MTMAQRLAVVVQAVLVKMAILKLLTVEMVA
jgi:hypothetical protein